MYKRNEPVAPGWAHSYVSAQVRTTSYTYEELAVFSLPGSSGPPRPHGKRVQNINETFKFSVEGNVALEQIICTILYQCMLAFSGST